VNSTTRHIARETWKRADDAVSNSETEGAEFDVGWGRLAGLLQRGMTGPRTWKRDTFAVALLNAGASLETVSTLLGHTSIRVTQKHYNPWVKSRQDALDVAVKKAMRS